MIFVRHLCRHVSAIHQGASRAVCSKRGMLVEQRGVGGLRAVAASDISVSFASVGIAALVQPARVARGVIRFSVGVLLACLSSTRLLASAQLR